MALISNMLRSGELLTFIFIKLDTNPVYPLLMKLLGWIFGIGVVFLKYNTLGANGKFCESVVYSDALMFIMCSCYMVMIFVKLYDLNKLNIERDLNNSEVMKQLKTDESTNSRKQIVNQLTTEQKIPSRKE